jgi:hypothetical protein
MIKLSQLLTEIIDLYSPDELEDKGITYDIVKDEPRRFIVNLKYKDTYYTLRILPFFSLKYPSLLFGVTKPDYKDVDIDSLINSPHTPRMGAAIFGLIRWWVDKHNIQGLEYSAEGRVRESLYRYYLEKHFKDFTLSKDTTTDDIIWILEKNKK